MNPHIANLGGTFIQYRPNLISPGITSTRTTHLPRGLIDDEHERPFAAQRVRNLAVFLRVRVRRRHREHRLGPARVFGEAGVILLREGRCR